MNTIRINVSLSKTTYEELAEEVEPRGRSRFIGKAIREALRERQNRRLAEEYREAAREIKRVDADLKGTIADGIR